jgi:hypothetical protein
MVRDADVVYIPSTSFLFIFFFFVVSNFPELAVVLYVLISSK